MKIKIYCDMCGKETCIELENDKRDGNMTLESIINYAKWIWQQNGENGDIYCSKECAA